MRLLRAKFKGLIGVYRGSGLKEIEIDFTKGRNKIVLIVGANGSGKSTIFNVLNPFPDSHDMYIAKEYGYKELDYELDDGTRYHIHIEYPISPSSGDRTTTKAFIQKSDEFGNMIELNKNGNIGSYKNTIYEEFKLDPNYMALAKLSSEDRGIVDKTPGERKKYVGAILESTLTYNNMYKTFNKRSSVFKSMLNSIVAKIDSVGDIEAISGSIIATESRITDLEKQKEVTDNRKAEAEARIRLNDPSGDLQLEYSRLLALKDSYNMSIGTHKSLLAKYNGSPLYKPEMTLRDCEKVINEIKSEISAFEAKIEQSESYINHLLSSQKESASMLNAKQAKLNEFNNELKPDELQAEHDQLIKTISERKQKLQELGISTEFTISREELLAAINTISAIKNQIVVLRDSYDDTVVQDAAFLLGQNDSGITTKIEQTQATINECNEVLSTIDNHIIRTNELQSRASILGDRPADCKNDGCPFIAAAIEASKQSPDKELEKLETAKQKYKEKLKEETANLEHFKAVRDAIRFINNLTTSIKSNEPILCKLPNTSILTDTKQFVMAIYSNNTFSVLDRFEGWVDYANWTFLLKDETARLEIVKANLKVFEGKESIIDDISHDIEVLTKELAGIEGIIMSTHDEIKTLKMECDNKHKNLEILTRIAECLNNIESDIERVKEIDARLLEMDSKMAGIEEAVQIVNECNTILQGIRADIKPLNDKLMDLRFSKNKWEEYQAELKMYTDKYNLVELLKKYTSPTKDGIQNVFIKMYMGQTLTMVNELLKRMFDGELSLGEFSIQETEFRIPCISNRSSIVNDDISSCSTAQRCMIALVLSFVLLSQSSTIYNIPEMDEIDAGLDQSNRQGFIPLIMDIMDIFNTSQCIMISHASESVLTNVDIVLLNPVNNEIPAGNIIFSYEEARKKDDYK